MNKINYIYLRVSTGLQDADSQMIGITNYCEKQGIKQMNITKDTVTGAKGWRDRKLNQIMSQAAEGDKIIVSEISRIGRSTADVLDFLAEAVKKKVIVIAVKNNITFDESISSKIFATVLALASEIERDFIRTRTKEGMANAVSKGVKIGRPEGSKSKSKLDSSSDQIFALLAANVSKAAICRLQKVSRNTLDRFLDKMEVAK
jgi:DNA invertase Pin-like site-specific DNA recombinase